jgi:hypothetical protein
MRVMAKNGLQAMALGQDCGGARRCGAAGQQGSSRCHWPSTLPRAAVVQANPPGTGRAERAVNRQVQEQVEQRVVARRLMSHPAWTDHGIGPELFLETR